MGLDNVPPLVARNGHRLRVLGIARISTEQQDRLSLDDQAALLRRWLDQRQIPYELQMISEQGSGECIDRVGILQAWEQIRSGLYDLVIAEDLGRIYRRTMAQEFCEHCEDYGTRLIAINDSIDTAQPNWRLLTGFASMRHELYNADTAKRIRRSHRNRFVNGGVIQFTIFGYLKPPGAKLDNELQKDPKAEAIYAEWFRRLDQGATYAEVADWLNDSGIPTGPFCRTQRWSVSMVARTTHNPILKGVRVRNQRMSKRVNKTGRRRSVKAPPGELLERYCPHLAFFDAAYFDRVIRIVDARNAHCRRTGVDGKDTRLGVSRKRTTWPGQHLTCGICGRLYHWTGSAARKCMICSGAQDYRCWNSIEDNGEMIGRKLAAAIFAEIMALPDFDPVFLGMLRQRWDIARQQSSVRQQEVRRLLAGIDQHLSNVTAAIAQMGINRTLQEKLLQLESDRAMLQDESTELARAAGDVPPLPSLSDIRTKAREVFLDFAPSDPEIHRLMCRLVPDLRVYPYIACDGVGVVLRAHFCLDLVALSDTPWPGSVAPILRREMVVDLFESPQRVRYREQVATLRTKGLTERQIGAELGITQPAVQRAAALSRRMSELGITDPYIRLTEPPNKSGLRRHLHARYRFEPLNKSHET